MGTMGTKTAAKDQAFQPEVKTQSTASKEFSLTESLTAMLLAARNSKGATRTFESGTKQRMLGWSRGQSSCLEYQRSKLESRSMRKCEMK